MSIEDDLRKEVGKRQGSAVKFTDIDGIGQKTEQKIKNTVIPGKGRVRGPSDVSGLTAQELAQEAGISESRAKKAIRGGGGNPGRKPRSNTGTVSARGARFPVGEFKPDFADKDKAEARFSSSLNRGIGRSQNAAIADKNKRAPVTTDFERWKSNKGELDFPGVDTPTESPDVRPKDLKQEQRPNTTDPERDRRAVERAEVTVAETDTGLLLESEAEASATDSDVIGAFVSGRAESRDVSVSRGEALRGERTGSIVSFAGPQFDANRERPRETDRREREEEMGIVPEQAFMQSGDSGGGMGASLTSEDRSVLETLARSNMASGDRPEKIEEARLSEDPSPEAREAVVETGESILNFRDEIEDPSRTDTEFFTSDDLDRVGSVVSKFRGDR
jgi:hypothetical protein